MLPVLIGLVISGVAVSRIVANAHEEKQITPEMRQKISPGAIASAKKWARKRGLPLNWVLATILVESQGKPTSTGDSGGRSVGLMQVNTVAHAEDMAAAGVTRTAMFRPDTNIEWGTKILRLYRDQVLEALGGRTPPAPVDIITRLAYKGPKTVLGVLRRGENPINIPWAPEAVVHWRNALTGRRLV